MNEQNYSNDRGAGFAALLGGWRESGRTLVMGVVNTTPDSFSDGGLFFDAPSAIAQAHRLLAEGADILDIGGESTRPGAERVSEADETARVVPVIEALAAKAGALISIDTVKPAVAEAAFAAGAHILNDVQGLQGDPALAGIAAQHGAGVVIMHNPGLLGASRGTEGDPVVACTGFFQRSLEIGANAGIPADRIALDPGFGFGKSLEQNLALLGRLGELKDIGPPLLIGTSRKSFIGKLLEREVGERLAGTLTTNVIAAMAGAAILRVHDVAEHVDAVRMITAIRSACEE
ncbi:MAG TPA: dihydropteroate synthase [Afifellaceae bacterium]|nr:dihydropteroate synthase [Afifellaceae bacterium]